MENPLQEAQTHALTYAELYGISLVRQLGFGNDGVVWETDNNSVTKAVFRQDTFERERDAYLRLFENQVNRLAEFTVPQLLNFHNRLMVLEVEFVFPPFIIDFGKAYLDRLPDYPPGAMEEWMHDRQEMFAEEEWKQVRKLLAALRAHGIHYLDPTPANIRFPRTQSNAN